MTGSVEDAPPQVFVSFNSADRALAGQLADALQQRGLRTWFDEDEIELTDVWRKKILPVLTVAEAAVVILGQSGLGPVQEREILLLLDRVTTDPDYRLVPVVLGDPGPVKQREPLAAELLLASAAVVEDGLDDGDIDRIADGIRGVHDPDVPSTLGPCPYPGLAPFQVDGDEPARFHGRDAELQRIAELLSTDGTVCILGPSGVGKSSVALAGLEKLRRQGGLGEPDDVRIVVVEPGSFPLDAMRKHLPGHLDVDAEPANELRRRLALNTEAGRSILVVDQLEAVFTRSADEDQRRRFVETLVHTITNPLDRWQVVTTMRSDMLGPAYEFRDLGSAIAEHEFTLGPMRRQGLHQAVQQPAWDAGARFAPGVVAAIVDDVVDQPNALPLMAVALEQMWPHASGDTLTIESYRLGGGVREALDRLGDSTIAPFRESDEALVRWLMLRLVERQGDQPSTRRTRPLAELEPADPEQRDLARRTIDALRDARVLVSGRGQSGPTVTFVHDAVVSSWPTLRGWIEDEQRNDPRLEELREAAVDWERAGRPNDLLLSRRRLRAIGDGGVAERSVLGRIDEDYLRRSRTRQRWLAVAGAGLVLVLVAALLGGLVGQLRAGSERRARELGDDLRLAADAGQEQDSRPDLGLLLAAEAVARSDEDAARSALVAGLTLDPQPMRFWSTGSEVALARILFPPGGPDTALVSDGGSSVRVCDLRAEACRTWLPEGPAQVLDIDGSGRQWLGLVALSSGQVLVGSLDDQPEPLAGVADGRVVAVHPDQPLLAIGHASGEVTVRQVAGQAVSLGRLAGAVVAVAYDPEARWVAATDGTTVSLFSAGTDQGVDSMWEGDVSDLAFSADGTALLVGDRNTGNVLVFDLPGIDSAAGTAGTDDGAPIDGRPRRLPGHRSAPTALAVGPDSVVTGGLDGDVRLWSLDRLVQVGPPFVAEPTGAGVELVDRSRTAGVGISPDRLRVYVFRRDGVLVTWDAASRSALARRTVTLPGRALDIAGLANGDVVALLADGTVVRYDGAGQEVSRLATDATEPGAVVAGTTGFDHAVTGETVEVVSEGGDRVVLDQLGRLGRGPYVAGFVPGEATLVVGDGDGALHVVDLAARTVLRSFSGQSLGTAGRSFSSLAVAPDGARVAVALAGSEDTAIRVLDLASGEVAMAVGHNGDVDAVVWAPSGDRLYSSSDDRSVIEWTGSELAPRRLTDHTDRVTGLALIERSGVLVSSSQDGTLRLWNVAGEGATALGGPARWFGSVVDTVTPAGPGQAVSLESDSLVWWSVDVDRWAELACAIAGRPLTDEETIRYLPDETAVGCDVTDPDAELMDR